MHSPHIKKTAHTILTIPIKQHPYSLPIVILTHEDKSQASIEALRFVKKLQNTNFGSSTINRFVTAFGQLYDYYIYAWGGRPLEEADKDNIIEHFAHDLFRGTISRDGSCPYGLYWTTQNKSIVQHKVNLLKDCFEHLSRQQGGKAIGEGAGYSDNLLNHFRQIRRAETSMFSHLQEQWTYKHYHKPIFKADQRKQVKLPPFPPKRTGEFIKAAKSIRDKLIYLLMFYEGPRISELCHLYVRDVCQRLDENECALIEYFHPEDAMISWVDSNNKKVETTRAEFLRQKYSLLPRTTVEPVNQRMKAGWKGRLLDSHDLRSESFWCSWEAGQEFVRLHREYMKIRRQAGDIHPYYFISLSKNRFGEPLALDQIRENFYTNCKRIGLRPNRRKGISPHGARHHYGWYLTELLQMPAEYRQVAMGHASVLSTMNYSHISLSEIRKQFGISERGSLEMPHEE